ncbi:MAG: KamA family radical SAM protein [Pirellulales bacterium]|nr:KamA family radical SAM protein [Pirellulales bacterium]
MQGKRVREANASRANSAIRVDTPAAVAPDTAPAGDAEEPPGSLPASTRHPQWKDVPPAQWDDWRWQMQHAVRTTRQLAELLPLPVKGLADLERLESKYKLALPPYYLSLIDANDPYGDPIGLQSLPHLAETAEDSSEELVDPLEEDQDSPVPGLTHRYPDRVLLITTPVCSMYCRFCTRKRVTMDREGWDAPSHDELRMIDYIRQHEQIHDCILSGGDALMLPPAKLRWFLTSLAEIPHVDVIRVGTRVPVTLPQKLFDQQWIDILHETGKVWVQTHFNHPREITPEAVRGCRNLINAGLPINNHTVLLKGVNDSLRTMRDLMRGLLRIKVRPYYLFHCDPVTGAGHFRTSVWKGLEIMEGLRGHMSGLGVPTYVIDGLYGAGKIPVMPNYVISASDQAIVLRNYEGMVFRYSPEDHHGGRAHVVTTTGVSDLLSGEGQKLVPAGVARMERRRRRAEAATTGDDKVDASDEAALMSADSAPMIVEIAPPATAAEATVVAGRIRPRPAKATGGNGASLTGAGCSSIANGVSQAAAVRKQGRNGAMSATSVMSAAAVEAAHSKSDTVPETKPASRATRSVSARGNKAIARDGAKSTARSKSASASTSATQPVACTELLVGAWPTTDDSVVRVLSDVVR